MEWNWFVFGTWDASFSPAELGLLAQVAQEFLPRDDAEGFCGSDFLTGDLPAQCSAGNAENLSGVGLPEGEPVALFNSLNDLHLFGHELIPMRKMPANFEFPRKTAKRVFA